MNSKATYLQFHVFSAMDDNNNL